MKSCCLIIIFLKVFLYEFLSLIKIIHGINHIISNINSRVRISRILPVYKYYTSIRSYHPVRLICIAMTETFFNSISKSHLIQLSYAVLKTFILNKAHGIFLLKKLLHIKCIFPWLHSIISRYICLMQLS